MRLQKGNASQLSIFNRPFAKGCCSPFFKEESVSKFSGVPSLFKEGFGEIYQSGIMKLRSTDQHYCKGGLVWNELFK
jgi:hypothetical protein